MDNRSAVREFLTSRRVRLTPQQAGLPGGGDRRVTGLRRREVAELANVSLEYYRRLERGSLRGVSDGVLEGLARALQLNPVERTYLFDLARVANSMDDGNRRPARSTVRPAIQLLLDEMTEVPAAVHNERLDFLAANRLMRALYSPMLDDRVRPANLARFVFLDERSKHFFVEWEYAAGQVAAVLRAAAARDPHDLALTELIEELSTRSADFQSWWTRQEVMYHTSGRKRIRHPIAGQLDFAYEAMDLRSEQALTLFVYTVEPGSSAEKALDVLAAWARTLGENDEHMSPLAPPGETLVR